MKGTGLLLLLALALLLGGALVSVPRAPADPLFQGKPESDWIKGVAYGTSLTDAQSKEQAQLWRDLGPEGLRVLERGLDRASQGRLYRQWRRKLSRSLPQSLARLLPDPRPDSQPGVRMSLVDLLRRLGPAARPALPALQRALSDENPGVRQIAINFFTSPEDDTAFLSQMPASQKRRLLPLFVRALSDTQGSWGLRNNAAIALRYYAGFAPLAAPPLAQALQDPAPQVRLFSADALNRVDPAAAHRAGAAAVVIALLRDPDGHLASRAASLLRHFTNDAPAVITALVETLHNPASPAASDAAGSLAALAPQHRDQILPELRKAAQLTNNPGNSARAALRRLEPRSPAPAAAR